MKKHFILSAFISLSFLSCKHDVPFPSSPEISFQRDVQPIIIGNCTQSGCHGIENNRKFELLTYEDVYNHGELNNTDPSGTRLYSSITGKGADLMPPDPYSPLTDTQIQTIFIWIKQGSKNN